jgi:hypothetical protein
MPKQQHQPWDIKSFSAGANTDVDKELLGASQEGEYRDAKNMRPNSEDGDLGSLDKIKGEVAKFGNGWATCSGSSGIIAESYICMAAMEINGQSVEVWCDETFTLPPMIRVDGVVVLRTSKWSVSVANPFQYHKNESCTGGEIYLTDNNEPPFIFNIGDMLTNLADCTGKYFENFNPSNFSIGLDFIPDSPKFLQSVTGSLSSIYTTGTNIITQTVGSGGLQSGYYQYGIRYVTAEGDRTQFSVRTNLIPTIFKETGTDYVMPHYHTHTTEALNTGRKNIIRFRINNIEQQYVSIEVVRYSYIGGTLPEDTVEPELIWTVQGIDNEESYPLGTIYDLIDDGATGSVISEAEDVQQFGQIAKAKAIRYFNNRLFLMNITYANRDVNIGDVEELSENQYTSVFPVVRNMGQQGHYSPFYGANYKSFQRGEKYGVASVFIDGKGERTFALELNDGFEMPNRRSSIFENNVPPSYLEASTVVADVTNNNQYPYAADNNGSATQTYEVFDMKNSVSKTSVNPYINIVSKTTLGLAGRTGDIYGSRGSKKNTVEDIGYQPWRPTGKSDTNENWDIPPVTAVQVYNQGTLVRWASFNKIKQSVASKNFEKRYKPQGFKPNYYALGAGVRKIPNIPSWAKGFYMSRTKRANRVICQGLGMYAMSQDVGVTLGSSKALNKMWAYFPDIDNGVIDQNLIDQFETGRYKVEFVSPLGFFTEIYNAQTNATKDGESGFTTGNIDLISYARVLFDDGRINAGDNFGYVAHGLWRNQPQNDAVGDGVPSGTPPSGFLFKDGKGADNNVMRTADIVGFTARTSEERFNNTYELTFPTNQSPYRYSNHNGEKGSDFHRQEMKKWHEPFYIINIVDTEAQIDNSQNVKEYLETGHYQKMESLIYVWGEQDDATVLGGGTIDIHLVDENLCEFGVNPQLSSYLQAYIDRYLYIKDDNGITKKFVNITYKTPDRIAEIYSQIETGTGYYGENDVKGVYTQVNVNESLHWKIEIKLINNTQPPEVFKPNIGDRIYTSYRELVAENEPGGAFYHFHEPSGGYSNGGLGNGFELFDYNYPYTTFFGGDTWIGETAFCPIDRLANSNGKVDTTQFKLSTGWPYWKWEMNPRVLIPENVSSGAFTNKIQNDIEFRTKYIRQMVVMSTLETRSSFIYKDGIDPDDFIINSTTSQEFPMCHYVMRGQEWDIGKRLASSGTPRTRVFLDYASSYPEEVIFDTENSYYYLNNNWVYGGFRLLSDPTSNIQIDFTHEPDKTVNPTKPLAGFSDETYYCTRIAWSEPREINLVDSPGVKTFLANSIFDLSDEQGQINFAWDALSAKGNNLYAFCESGVALLLSDKRVISEANGNELALVGTDLDQAILDELWISKSIGMEKESWRTWAEYDDVIYWANTQSAYALSNNEIMDIAKKAKYHKKIRTEFCEVYTEESYVVGGYDALHSEYWLQIGRDASLGVANFVDIDLNPYTLSTDYDSSTGLFSGFSIVQNEVVNCMILQSNLEEVTINLPDYSTQLLDILINEDNTDTLSFNQKIYIKVEQENPNLLVNVVGQDVCNTGDLTVDLYWDYETAKEYWDENIFPCIEYVIPGEDFEIVYVSPKQNPNCNWKDANETLAVNGWETNQFGNDIMEVRENSPAFGNSEPLATRFIRPTNTQWICYQQVYNDRTNEWCWESTPVETAPCAEEPEVCKTFAYNVNQEKFNGTYDYCYDKYLTIGNKTYGMKLGFTYDIGSTGYLLGGLPYEAIVYQVAAPRQILSKEFIRIRVASDVIPSFINFVEEDTIENIGVIATLSPADSQFYLKDYGAYEQYIPRRSAEPFYRIQGRILMYKVVHNREENFRVTDIAIQYKELK